jgi:hypothetical protein
MIELKKKNLKLSRLKKISRISREINLEIKKCR